MLSWENLDIGYKHSLIYPFSGKITNPGIYAILGQNGCGKSTLLKTWIGLVSPRKGLVKLQNSPLPHHHDISNGIAYVPQFHSVNKFFHITVFDFIMQGFGPNHKMTEQNKLSIYQLLTQWQLEGLQNKSFHELSGGQKVRCMLVRAIISNPKVLFLDEPLASLDICCQHQLMETLDHLVKTKHVFVFMVDHHFDNHSHYITGKFTFHRHHDDSLSSVLYS